MSSIEPSNAGPFELGLNSDLGANESRTINVAEITGGPRNKKGFFAKFFGQRDGFDYGYVVNTTGYPLKYEASGGVNGLIPSATSAYIGIEASDRGSVIEEAHPIRSITITNNTANVLAAEDISVQVGNVSRQTDKARFGGPQQILRDVIPGVR